MIRRGLLIVNPQAGRRRGRRIEAEVTARLRGHGFALEVARTASPGEATALARTAAAGGADVVFSLGGDGTLREAAEGLLGSRTALAVLPAGTTNVVAIALGLPLDAVAAAAAAAQWRPRAMDVGLAAGRVFLMQASAGFDGYLMARLRGGWKASWGKAAIAAQGVSAWLRYDYREITVRAEGETRTGSHVAICNLAHYGGRYLLAPAARCDDRRLDLRVFTGGRMATLAEGWRLLRGRPGKEAWSLQVERATLLGPPGLTLQIDGDPLCVDPPVEIELAAEQLQVLAPPAAPQG
jgi:diacylglycerol kinase (ATP)